MESPSRESEADADAASGEQTPPPSEPSDEPAISAYSTTPERKVFTESGNGDGWISTDVTVEVER